MSSPDSSSSSSLAAVTEQFIELLRTGKPISVESMIARYPEHAQEIRDDFSAIIAAEHLFSKPDNQAYPEIPREIGPYSVDREIGRGGMGRVFAGVHIALERPVAIKVLRIAPQDRGRGLVERFEREARMASQLNHPNIVPVYDHGTDGAIFYIAMHHVRGIDLSKIVAGMHEQVSQKSLRTNCMNWQMIGHIACQMSSAIAYAHSKGIVHRDVKPANVLLEPSGHIWVSDFGLAKQEDEDAKRLSMTGDIIGTPRYMAPEQLRGAGDHRSDIYGIGITLYELAVGDQAWSDVGTEDLIQHRQSLHLPSVSQLNPEIPEPLNDIIMKCVSFNPEDRYQSANELHYVLNRFLHGHKNGDRRKTRNSSRTIMNRLPVRIAKIGIAIACFVLTTWSVAVWMRKEPELIDPVAHLQLFKDEKFRHSLISKWPEFVRTASRDPQFKDAFRDFRRGAVYASIPARGLSEDKQAELKARLDLIYAKGNLTPLEEQALVMHAGSEFSLLAPLTQFNDQLRKSGLPADEKYKATQLLLSLMRDIAGGTVSTESFNKLSDEGGVFLRPEPASDEEIRRFVKVLGSCVTEPNSG